MPCSLTCAILGKRAVAQSRLHTLATVSRRAPEPNRRFHPHEGPTSRVHGVTAVGVYVRAHCHLAHSAAAHRRQTSSHSPCSLTFQPCRVPLARVLALFLLDLEKWVCVCDFGWFCVSPSIGQPGGFQFWKLEENLHSYE